MSEIQLLPKHHAGTSVDLIAEARKVIEEERQAREKRCMEKVQKDLDEENCVLNVYLERMPNGYFVPRVGVAAV